MNIYRNDKLIKRNSIIAQFCMLGGLAVLGTGMYISFKSPELVSVSFGALILGFLLSQIGIYYSNRWGRRPRQDELIDQALKGLDKKYSLYHYTSPIQHLLVGPTGVWAILPYYQRGTITYSNGRWHQKGGNLYLKMFAQEGLGRPDLDLAGDLDRLNSFFMKTLPESEVPQLNGILVFTNPRAAIDIPQDANPPAESVLLKDLKDAVRKSGKAKGIVIEKVKLIEDVLANN